MEYLLARIRFSWGFAARLQPQSKMRMALKYPPPTTLLGALAYPFLRAKEGRIEVLRKGKKTISAADSLRKIVIEVAASLSEEPLIYGDYLRVHRFYRGKVDKGVTALPVSLTYSNGEGIADIVYVMKGLNDNIERAAWGITRLGSRESVVSVESVHTGRVKVITGNETSTRFSFPLRDGLEVRGKGTVIYAVDWKRTELGSYGRAGKIPYFYPKENVTVRGELKWFELEVPWGKEVVIYS